jgi:hypothetical protein
MPLNGFLTNLTRDPVNSSTLKYDLEERMGDEAKQAFTPISAVGEGVFGRLWLQTAHPRAES